MTQFQLALRVGVTVQSISNWETGLKQPTVSRFQRLADALGVRMDEIRLTERKDGNK
jgi:transcriptional regulator with XRE-family HTH domain